MKRPQFLFIILFMLGAQACGQTGPLYLPDEPPPIHVEKEES